VKTHLDCIPCFLRQALEAARITGADEKMQKKIVDEVCKIIPNFSFDASPPEMGVKIHRIIKELTSNKDPYKDIKKHSQKLALSMYPFLKQQVEEANDSLAFALKVATIGNVIDLAVNDLGKIEKALEELSTHKFAVFEYDKFKKTLHEAKTILYLGDNAGETVFDKILIEELPKDRKIYYGVRGFPAINDALEEDAREAGIGKYAEIISNGSDAPGTFLDDCSKEFKDIFFNADLIISKGQGNFETLYGETKHPIFFLFKIKCPPVAKELNCRVEDLILKSVKPS
jgi:uncharacterized protein with ATP-grasp and redox domains